MFDPTAVGQPTAAPQPPAAPPSPAPLSSVSRAGADGATERDVVLDVVRTGALAIVVLWHWVFTTVRWTDDGPRVGNPVGVTPGMWALTWIAQVMPAFFIVGGALHATSDAAPREFWRSRIRRLVLPVAPLLALAALAAAAAHLAGRDDLVRGVVLVISPMWFLAVYLVCVLAAPAARWAHGRFGWRVPLVGALACVCVDSLRFGAGMLGAATGAAAFVCVWLTVHQLGFHFSVLRNATRRTKYTVMVGGFIAMALAVLVGPYPAAMVGVPGQRVSNMGPPTLMVVFAAVAQLGLLALASPHLARFGERHRRHLATAGNWSMTVFAWHLCAFSIFWAALVALGFSVDSTVDVSWWLQRPLWLAGPAFVAIPLCRFTSRFDPRSRTVR